MSMSKKGAARCGSDPVCDVVNDDRSSGPTVVHRGQRVVALLASSIPDLELYRCVIQCNSLRQKCSANCGLLVLEELPPHEPEDKTRFSDGTVAQEHELELEDP
jgi:hypothetical protein